MVKSIGLDIGTVLILFGIAIIAFGLIWKFNIFPFGKLPGDIIIEDEKWKFYFPIATSILVSLILTLIFFIMSRNLTKTTPFKAWSFLEHPKNECLSQTAPFKVRWHIVFLISRLIKL